MGLSKAVSGSLVLRAILWTMVTSKQSLSWWQSCKQNLWFPQTTAMLVPNWGRAKQNSVGDNWERQTAAPDPLIPGEGMV